VSQAPFSTPFFHSGQLHQALAARILARGLGNDPVVVRDPDFEGVGVRPANRRRTD
jgi:hypothetical protein